MNDRLTPAICVLGGGPAGAACARRLAQLGHSVVVVEKRLFPRPHIGESLTPGVLPLLDVLGVKERIEHQGFLRPQNVLLHWPPRQGYKSLGPVAGFQVDRGKFDSIMLDAAQEAGAIVLQGAQLMSAEPLGSGRWDLTIVSDGRHVLVERCFVIDASGRRGIMGGRKRRYGTRTMALWNYWRGCSIGGDETRVEAGTEEWYWGAPLPDGSFNATVFVDGERFKHDLRNLGSVNRVYEHLLARSDLLSACSKGHTTSVALACDASCYTDDDALAPGLIKIGEALFSVDPLSSQGVQIALGTALHAAAVVNTILRRPEDQTLAAQFYCQRQRESVAFHGSAAAHLYAQAAAQLESAFWKRRAENEPESSQRDPNQQLSTLQADVSIQLSAKAQVLSTPCMEGDFIVQRQALSHPGLLQPAVFLGNIALAPLIEHLRTARTVSEILSAWSHSVPLAEAVRILGWLHTRGVVEVVKRRGGFHDLLQ